MESERETCFGCAHLRDEGTMYSSYVCAKYNEDVGDELTIPEPKYPSNSLFSCFARRA